MRKGLAVLIVALASGNTGAGHAEQRKTEFGTSIRTGSGFVQYHNTCVTFEVWFISGTFFDGLRQYKTPAGMQFMNKKKKVAYRNFPDDLMVDIAATPFRCPLQPTEITPPDYAAGLMTGASFKVAWKRDDEVRPVIVRAVEERHRTASWHWDYFLALPSKDVPLTDSLVIDVSLRRGISQAHLTADLNSRF